MIPSGPPIQQIKDSMRVTWMAGNFGIVAKTIFAGCRGLGQLPRHPVLRAHADVAYGTGNVAIALARHQGAPSLPASTSPPNLRAKPANVPPPKTSPPPSTKAMPNVPSQGFSSPP